MTEIPVNDFLLMNCNCNKISKQPDWIFEKTNSSFDNVAPLKKGTEYSFVLSIREYSKYLLVGPSTLLVTTHNSITIIVTFCLV